jgi:uncharacterized membrane protein
MREAMESGKLPSLIGLERRHTEIACGPIPPPTMLAEYKNIDNRIVEIFMDQWVAETKYRRNLNKEKIAIQKDFNEKTFTERRWGQICATIICFAAFLTAAYCVKSGYPTAAGIIGGGALVSIVTVFITGRRHVSKRGRKTADSIPSESTSTESLTENDPQA